MAVYTEVTDEELAAFIAGYDVGDLLSYKGIAEGVENTNYVVHTTREPLILTLYEKRVARSDLPFFVGLMEHLAGKGVPCPVPRHDRKGETIGELAGRAAALVTFLEGFWIRRPKAEHCARVGEALARLHGAGADFTGKRTNALGPSGWQPLFDRFRDRANEISPGLEGVIADELAALLPAWPQNLPSGVIHADLFPDNVFFVGSELSGLIDFYFACNDAFAYDLAICLNAWCFEPDHAYNMTKGRALLKGYEQVRPLSAAERAAMPMLARGAALRFLLTRSYDWLNTPKNAVVSPHDPIDYLRRLRFHQSVGSIAGYIGEAP
ncbi:MAG: homoserine kinase [Hyphomicrobiaceae bacterium]|nr:homoserine kinase [Hyphomicrobiaceae bacterium]